MTFTTNRENFHCCGIPVVQFGQVQCNASGIYFEQIFVDRADVQSIFKNVRRNKKVYAKRKSEKYPRHVQHFVVDLKMDLLVKIVINFKVKIIFLKKIDLICVTGSEFASY